MLLGVHVSIAGHIYDAVTRASALGCTVMQIFSRDPRQWRRARISPEDAAEFRRLRSDAGIERVFVHVPYLINLASPINILYNSSIRGCIADIKAAEAIGAEFVVVHCGSHKKSGERFGIKRVAGALERITAKTAGCGVGILLENTAGSGSWLGYEFSHQRKILAKVADHRRVGLCLDTCHAYAAGYDLASQEGLDECLSEIEREVGLEKLKLVHLNDCRSALGSRLDIHEHIGKGSIGSAGMRRVITDRRLAKVPMVLETPKDSDGADRRNLAMVKRLRHAKKA